MAALGKAEQSVAHADSTWCDAKGALQRAAELAGRDTRRIKRQVLKMQRQSTRAEQSGLKLASLLEAKIIRA